MNTLVLPSFVRRVAALGVALFVLSPVWSTQPANPGNPDQPDRNPPFSSLVVLGDSLSDTGRTFVATGGAVPPAPYYFNGRVSNGPIWAEHLAPSLRLAYDPLDNFSWAGANTGRINVYPGLPGMLDELDELLPAFPRRLDKKALYVVFGGSNDFFRILVGGEAPAVVIPQAIGNLIRIVRSLQAAGADHIVVVDLPDIGLTPRARAGGPAIAGAATYLSAQFNQLLKGALNQLDFPVVRASAFALLNAMTANPAAYGLTNVTDQGLFAGPVNGATYLFWDDIHPTSLAHRHVAAMVFNAVAEAGLMKQLLKHP
jgi:phospholipase/lecithinase/hemolysin